MKTTHIKKIGIILLSYVACAAQYTADIRVMTYNINAEKHASGSYSDIAQVIKEINSDISGLQKVDSCNSRNSADVLKWIGEKTDRVYSFAPAIKNYQGSTGSYGVGFLTKESPDLIRRLWIEHIDTEQDRAVLEISITMSGEKVRVIVTHLAHEGEAYRTSQIEKIIPWIDSNGTTTPVIIMADFNATANENSMKLFETAGFSYVKTKNGQILDTTKNQGINHILYRPADRWNVKDAGNPAYTASNRNPVWADLELLNPVTTKWDLAGKCNENQNRFFFIRNGLFQYYLHNDAQISISLYNLSGIKMTDLCKNQFQKNGNHSIELSPDITAAGIFRCVFSVNGRKKTANVAIVK